MRNKNQEAFYNLTYLKMYNDKKKDLQRNIMNIGDKIKERSDNNYKK